MFIVFEGIDNSGKTTQINLLKGYLKEHLQTNKIITKKDIYVTRDPGGTLIGEKIRKILLDTDNEGIISPYTEAMLYASSRTQLVDEIIKPMLKDNIIILDRFYYSTIAYQGYGLQNDLNRISSIAKSIGIIPDLVIYLDISIEESLKRQNKPADRLEKRSLDFKNRVRQGYLELVKNEDNMYVINGEQRIENIFREIRDLCTKIIK